MSFGCHEGNISSRVRSGIIPLYLVFVIILFELNCRIELWGQSSFQGREVVILRILFWILIGLLDREFVILSIKRWESLDRWCLYFGSKLVPLLSL